MTTLSSSMSTAHRAQAAEYRRNAYLNDGWTSMKRWNGRDSALVEAGIVGPSREVDSWTPAPTTGTGSSDMDAGVHVFRYRYLDPETGYVSNPSEERTLTVSSGAGKLTFPIDDAGAGAANVIRSTDAKAGKIIMEATTLGSSEFFKAAEALTTASSIVVEITDAQLELQQLPWPETGHDPPPIAANLVSHRERLWLFGQVEHSTGVADFTASSTDVDEGTTDPEWSADALGDDTATPVSVRYVTWLIQKDGDAEVYEVDYYDESANKLVLASAYAGTTETDASYKLFSRSNVIWVSNPGYPEGFSPLKFLNGPNGERAGDLTAGIGYGGSMILFSASAMFRLTWDRDPLTDPVQTPLSSIYGALSQRVVLEIEGTVYSMDRLGWQAWSGTFPKHVSRPVDDALDLIDWSYSANFHAVWLPRQRAIRWHVVYTGDSSAYPMRYVQLDVDTGAWSTGRFLVGISESRLVPTADGLQVYYGDENGHLWIADTGTCEGCSADYSHLTVGASSTTTLINVSASAGDLPTANVGLAGCMAYHVESGEERLIESNLVGQLTVASAFSSAPEAGDTIWVGRILSRLKTRAMVSPRRGPRHVHEGRTCFVQVEPLGSQRHAVLRIYEDYSSTAQKATSWKRSDLNGLVFPGNVSSFWGVSTEESDGYSRDWLLELNKSDGVFQVPIGGDKVRVRELELEINEPDAPIEIVLIEVEGAELGRVQ